MNYRTSNNFGCLHMFLLLHGQDHHQGIALLEVFLIPGSWNFNETLPKTSGGIETLILGSCRYSFKQKTKCFNKGPKVGVQQAIVPILVKRQLLFGCHLLSDVGLFIYTSLYLEIQHQKRFPYGKTKPAIEGLIQLGILSLRVLLMPRWRKGRFSRLQSLCLCALAHFILPEAAH